MQATGEDCGCGRYEKNVLSWGPTKFFRGLYGTLEKVGEDTGENQAGHSLFLSGDSTMVESRQKELGVNGEMWGK